MKRLWIVSGLACALALGLGGCGDSGSEEEVLEESGATDELVDPGLIGQTVIEHGIPAPGAECNIDASGGVEIGDLMKDVEFLDCDGNVMRLHDAFCGASVGWMYFHFGSG